MSKASTILVWTLCFLLGYFVGYYKESSYINNFINGHLKVVDSKGVEIVGDDVNDESSAKTIKPIVKTHETSLFEQECKNKETGWDALNTLILKNNTVYNVIKDHPHELDLWSWDSFEKYINVLFPEVANSSKSDTIRVIEVGSFKGKSAFDHATKCREMAQKFNKKCIVIAIDTWLGSMEHYEDPKYALKVAEEYATNLFWIFLNNMKLKNVSDIVYPIRLPSSAAAHVLHCFKIEADMILIDADHDYLPVLRDIELFYPLVRNGGVFYGHDYPYSSGIRRAVKEFLEPRKTKVEFWLDGPCFFMRKKEEDTSFFNKY